MTVVELLQTNATVFISTVAIVSLIVGSFLNVVIYRLPIMMENSWIQECQELAENTNSSACNKNEGSYNLITPASTCPGCNQKIKPWHNIPIISYLLLGGKCGNCKSSISIQYPLVEAITAILSVWVALHFDFGIQAAAGILITWCLITLSMIDFKYTLLPDDITLPLLWLGLLASTQFVFTSPVNAIYGAALGYMSLWLVYQLFKLFTGKEGMGYGDFKLLAVFGAWLGWEAIPMIILLSSVVGAVVGISLIVIMGRDKNIPIPFGPYLAAAGWLSMMYGNTIL